MSGEGINQMAIANALSAGVCLTTEELARLTGLERKRVAMTCCRLVSRDWIDRLERGCFVLSEEGRRALANGEIIKTGPKGPLTQGIPRRPKRRTVRDKLWYAIRLKKKFTLGDLIELTGSSHANAARYVQALAGAGYLTTLRREAGFAPTSNGYCRWSLTDDPGSKTLVLRAKGRTIFDPNRNETRDVKLGGRVRWAP
ncbi:MarR family protein [Hartmannibacter diazotrophicus]|uniref:MarR family protein n=1 Tax=Hartmannibacter diazotrophicus TaxID=1482074 RepID=A0A2C9D6I3_9HYPH|nr:hypothetical protein [Hartmannibacter diazotrophicus]SON55779.1 MarR family protein [Hartmannibacter diazotrophicus]